MNTITLNLAMDDAPGLYSAANTLTHLANKLTGTTEVELPVSVPEVQEQAEVILDPIEEVPTPPTVEEAFTPTVDLTEATYTDPAGNTAVPTDKANLPWDERIHSGAKSLKADGFWKLKRGVDKDVVATVEAELSQLMDIPAPVEDVVPTPPTETPAPPAEAPAPVAVSEITVFPQLLTAVTSAFTTSGLTPERLATVLQGHGIAALPLLAKRPDLVPTIAAELGL